MGSLNGVGEGGFGEGVFSTACVVSSSFRLPIMPSQDRRVIIADPPRASLTSNRNRELLLDKAKMGLRFHDQIQSLRCTWTV
ncbi:hypothetical protein NL676_035497 [Syzygium grande]|nr:hypothetical protein NL676_035497 [Syzygium grande]